MINFFRKQKINITAKALTTQTDQTLDELMQSSEGTDAMLQRLGISRQQALEAILADEEVEACREDLRAAMLAQAWRITGDSLNEDDINRLWRVVKSAIPVLAEVALTAKLNGYGVARYVFAMDEDGFLYPKKIINFQGKLTRFKPKADGNLYWDEKEVNTQVQHLLLVNRPTDTQPAGEMAAARLYPAIALRKQGFIYAAQFIKRYAQPYLVGKIEGNNEEDHRNFVQRLFAFISGGAMSISRDDDVQMLQNNADGQAFKRLENLADTRIQKLLLGKVRLSSMENGSRAAQETEEKSKDNRIDAYLILLQQAMQHLIDAVLLVNLAWGRTINAPKGVWFEFAQEEQIDKLRAERDKIYLDTGKLIFTKKYYRDVLGLEEDHFKLIEETETHEQKLAIKLAAQPQSHMPLTSEQIIMQPKIQAVLAALAECKNYNDFQVKLNSLDLSDGDELLIQRLVGNSVDAWLQGTEA